MATRTGRSGLSGVIEALKLIIRLVRLPRFWSLASEYFGPEFTTMIQLVVDVVEALMTQDDQWYKIDIESPAGPEDEVPTLAARFAGKIDLDAIYLAAKAKRGL